MPASNKILEKRKQIDEIDKNLLKLLNKRAELSLEIRDLKRLENNALYDPKREEEIVHCLCKSNQGPLYNENVEQLFRQIMKILRGLPDAK